MNSGNNRSGIFSACAPKSYGPFTGRQKAEAAGQLHKTFQQPGGNLDHRQKSPRQQTRNIVVEAVSTSDNVLY